MNIRLLNRWVWCPLMLLITSCGYVESTGKNHRLVQSTRGMDPDTPIACQYQTRWQSNNQPVKTELWHFFRTPNRIERYRPDLKTREIWQKESDERIIFSQVYLDEKMVIEYFPDQFKLTQSITNWATISSLVDPMEIRRDMLLAHTANDHNMMIEYFVKQPSSTGYEVAWLPHLHLPIDLLYRSKASKIETLLLGCQRLEDSKEQPGDDNAWMDFRKIDAVDLGDLEHDPALKALTHRFESQSLTVH